MGNWYRSIFDLTEEAKKKGLILYGAGVWGKIAVDIFNKLDILPICFCDDAESKQGMMYCGIPVMSLSQAVKQYPDAIYVLSINDNIPAIDRIKMLERLKEKKVSSIYSSIHIRFYTFLLDIDLNQRNKENENCSQQMLTIKQVSNLLVLNHMSNSGSLYLEQILDSHPSLLMIPAFNVSLKELYEERLQYLNGDVLIVEMAAQMASHMKSSLDDMCLDQSGILGCDIDKNGNFERRILVNPERMFHCLKEAVGKKEGLSSLAHTMKAYYVAYNNCIGRSFEQRDNLWIVYHRHEFRNLGLELEEHFAKEEFNRIEHLVIIREPLQHFNSVINTFLIRGVNKVAATDAFMTHILHADCGMLLEKVEHKENIRAIRFEDLKMKLEETMHAFCKYYEISYDDCFYRTTANGIDVYFPTTKENGEYCFITGQDSTAVTKKDFSATMSQWDQIRFNIAFQKFQRAYGYQADVPDFMDFSKQGLKELYSFEFKCSKIMENALEEMNWRNESTKSSQEVVCDTLLEYMVNYKETTQYYDYIKA